MPHIHHTDHVRVAVACDDGVVRIFVIQAGMSGMQYIRSLPRVQGRALSCAWHPTARDVLVVGSGDGCIRAWNVAQGSELVRITAGRWFCSHGGGGCGDHVYALFP